MTAIATFGRAEFLSRYWAYQPGEHVTILGPTGSGKTWLGYQLLASSAHPKLPGVVMVMKPRDKTVTGFTKTTGFRRVRSWPPTPNLWQPRPPGYVLWPRHTFDIARDDAMMQYQFNRAMLDSYRRGDRIVFADEVFGLSNELGLNRTLLALWTRGRSMGCGLWAASQKPTHIPLHAYSMAEHLFLFNDPDVRARKRFSEIGGIDPRLVIDAVSGLRKHEAVYIRRTGPHLCIISP